MLFFYNTMAKMTIIFLITSPLRKAVNSMIFICMTPDPKGERLKIIELGSPPFGG